MVAAAGYFHTKNMAIMEVPLQPGTTMHYRSCQEKLI